MKAVVATFNQEKALVGAFSVITNLRMELFEALVDMAACIYTIYLPRCAQPRPVLADLHSAAAWQGQGPLRGGEARGAAPRPAHQPPPGGGQQRGHQPRIHRQPQQRQPPALRLAQGRNITIHRCFENISGLETLVIVHICTDKYLLSRYLNITLPTTYAT